MKIKINRYRIFFFWLPEFSLKQNENALTISFLKREIVIYFKGV